MATVGNNIAVGDTLRVYRLAVAATGEFTNYFGGVAQAYQAIEQTVAELNELFAREFSIRLDLVSGTELVFADPDTDPFTNGSPLAMANENQSVVDSIVGTANYDVGHVFSVSTAGGLAYRGVVGWNNYKARGTSSLTNPIGVNWLNHVAHEVAHQFGAGHTFNGVNGSCSGNRDSTSAYEPGSGSTLLAYAGLCGADDLQPRPDTYYHATSYEEINVYLGQYGFAAPNSTLPTGNTPPSVDGGPNYTIPARTPFALTAIGSDPDAGDTLTYTWEQIDLGPTGRALSAPDDGVSPLFRSQPPSTDPTRFLPHLDSLLTGAAAVGEMLPTTNRPLNFRVTVRDGAGGVNSDDVLLTVVDTGAPFRVTSPNTAVTWTGGTMQTIAWNVAGANANGINAAEVRILLSTDGGRSFPFELATTANDGVHELQTPNINTSAARVKVQGANNIFFDISDVDFTLAANPALPGVTIATAAGGVLVEEGGAGDSYTLALNTAPAGVVEVAIVADGQTLVSLDGVQFAPSQTAVFTSTAPQTVYVRAVNDLLDEGPHQSVLRHAVTASTSAAYPTTLLIDNMVVRVVDDEFPPVIGVDFDYIGFGDPPAGWAQNQFLNFNHTDLPRDDGAPTTVDLSFAPSGTGWIYTDDAVASSVPQHSPNLQNIGGYSYRSNSISATWSGLDPAQSYGVFVFGLTSAARQIAQNVAIVGATPLPTIVQELVAGQLMVNGEVGSNARKLATFEQVVSPSASGTITISVTPRPGSEGVALAGLALRPILATAAPMATIVGRRTFYNGSLFDGYDPAGNAADDSAIAGDKAPLLPGGSASFANYTSFRDGLTGVMIDIADLADAAALSAADFTLRLGNDNAPANWSDAPTPTISVRPGAGSQGADRIVLTWPAGAIVNTWLEVSVRASAATGLSSDDVFYFGNAIGETGDAASDAVVNGFDFIRVRDNPRGFFTPAAVDNLFDINRDGLVNATDLLLVRQYANGFGQTLQLISPPASFAQGAGQFDEFAFLADQFAAEGEANDGDGDDLWIAPPEPPPPSQSVAVARLRELAWWAALEHDQQTARRRNADDGDEAAEKS